MFPYFLTYITIYCNIYKNELSFRQGTEVPVILEYGKPKVTMFHSEFK